MDDETPENEAEPDNIEDKRTEHTSEGMNLCTQSRKDYNHNNYNHNMFNITYKTQDNGIILSHFT